MIRAWPSAWIRRAPHRHGLTLVELLMALAGTAVIGVAVASMMTATTYGTESSKDMRSLVARIKVVNARVGAAIRGSRLVLAEGNDFVVLWTRDLDENDAPSLLEIRRIDFDSGTGRLNAYQAPTGTTDVPYNLSDDFEAITDVLMGTASFPAELWARDATAWAIELNHVDPQQSTLISYQLTLQTGDMSDTAINVVHLRNE